MLKNFILVLKGIAIGTANVIPGVSGGTIALITGVFERLINAIKSFNIPAIKLLIQGKLKEFARHTDLGFLLLILSGMVVAILSAARLFDFLFIHYPVYIWAFFFGLILASIWYVFRTITKWDFSVIAAALVSTAIALGITFITPARENDDFFYLMICGAVSMCSMVLPGLSGSFVLIIMGNYHLVAIDSINHLRLEILIPFFLGAGLGLLGFSYILSWVFRHYRNQTLALLTGFMVGSVGVLWPWKQGIMEDYGDKSVVVGYQYNMPGFNLELLFASLLIISAIAIIILMERHGARRAEDV
jgi:putative membrane protein